MTSSNLLRSLSIKTPCSARWEEMRGNEQVRFCQHCDLNVTDISHLTPQAAISLVLRSGGSVCLRIHRDPAGEVVTRSAPQRLHVITRRASRIAAGAFTAVMGLSATAYAQTSSTAAPPSIPTVAATAIRGAGRGNTWLRGTVADTQGAVIPGATVTVTSERTKESQQTTSDGNGVFGVWVSDGESYEVTFEMEYWIKTTVQHVTPDQVGEITVDGVLEPAVSVNGGAMFAIEYVQPLVKAAYADDLQQLQELLRQGVDPNQVEEDGTRALDLAVGRGDLVMSQILVNAGARADRAIFWYAHAGDPRLLDLLLSAGANINQTSDDGSTPLIMAAYGNDSELIRSLVATGASVDIQNFAGDSALMVAARVGNDEVVKALLAAGASFSLRNIKGEDAFQIALDYERTEICDLLREAGAAGPPSANSTISPVIVPRPSH